MNRKSKRLLTIYLSGSIALVAFFGYSRYRNDRWLSLGNGVGWHHESKPGVHMLRHK